MLMTRPNKLECLYLAITFQSSLTFAGNTRSLPKKEASERCSNWIGFSLCPQILRLDWKGFTRTNPLTYQASSSVMKEKSFITLTTGQNGIKLFFFVTSLSEKQAWDPRISQVQVTQYSLVSYLWVRPEAVVHLARFWLYSFILNYARKALWGKMLKQSFALCQL